MSIPPLVCSTPPPPEQCEDDKEADDFDLNYDLSQEDDSAEYDYGNYSSFNHFPSSIPESGQELKSQREKSKNEMVNVINHIHVSKEINRVEFPDDDVIEDLDLKIDHEPAVRISKNATHTEVNFKEHSATGLTTNIPFDSSDTQDEPNLTRSNSQTIAIDSNVNSEMVPNEMIDEKIKNTENNSCTKDSDELSLSNLTKDIAEQNVTTLPQEIETNIMTLQQETENNNVQENNLEDFEDFDDFQFITSNNKPGTTLDTCENPWENEVSENTGLGEFTANFESNEVTLPPSSSEVHKENDSDDDFGDFDEFKSVNETKSDISPPDITFPEEVPVLNLQSSDSENQIIERINEVIHSIFQQEIVEPDSLYENRIESLLGVTWGYLLETDVRQPYIVNWNNSLAQKTLLKALCIDSRNILFGPKWSSNMPKYAANLSTAPLQPQKQPGQSNAPQNETAHHEKALNKTSWVDPFTSDGQEFTYAEALLLDLEHLMATLDQMAHNHSTLKISELLSHACSTENDSVVIEAGPTDLDVFEASVTAKTDKIYSNTLSMQPIRQINLPDTHIFTPTDSETPRSKTIHYNSSPAGLITNSDNVPQPTSSLQNDNDYWEFQDFRGISQSNNLSSGVNEELNRQTDTTISKEISQKSNYNIETQVLQPVKLELVMPTLNWPAPGEVKETFDDFTDFMSNSSSNDEKIESSSKIADMCNKLKPGTAKNTRDELGTNDNLDDDFEMFQSAILQNQNTSQPVFGNTDKKLVRENASSKASSQFTDFDVSFSTFDKDLKSENISYSHTKPIEHTIKIDDNISKMNESIFSSPTIQATTATISTVLQPTIATPSGTKTNHQKMSQILEPLSLESYSQINWPNPGINLQDLSRFNPVESLQSLKSESNSQSKTASPVHSQKGFSNSQTSDDDIWGEFVSSKPKHQTLPKKATTFTDDDEWTDFVSSPSVNPHNGLNTISLNVHTNSSLQKSSNTSKFQPKVNEIPLDIPTLNYITPKTASQTSYNERHFQNL